MAGELHRETRVPENMSEEFEIDVGNLEEQIERSRGKRGQMKMRDKRVFDYQIMKMFQLNAPPSIPTTQSSSI